MKAQALVLVGTLFFSSVLSAAQSSRAAPNNYGHYDNYNGNYNENYYENNEGSPQDFGLEQGHPRREYGEEPPLGFGVQISPFGGYYRSYPYYYYDYYSYSCPPGYRYYNDPLYGPRCYYYGGPGYYRRGPRYYYNRPYYRYYRHRH